ncbi:putative pentatricopeptide repeat-containing protein [Prunus yedoensis var. nudiflora]|uniref:Putative pentatricopeptide repeat-containing protein n=1 Tax=Prunus yedoensis var. nudiflora TaxID=2094558 RepID=A0A314YIH3_PRUYE|nr:putative pentatricopeptide repeat-containing protein [Prunus yedoensis var. nudiflora]
MLKMMMRTNAASSSYCSSISSRGMPCLHPNSTVVFVNNYFAFFSRSQASKAKNSRRTQLDQLAKDFRTITNVEDALNVFDRMLHLRPLPSLFRFTKVLCLVARLKQYSTVISSYNQMAVSGMVPDVYVLNILINCFCHLNQMGSSFSVLGKFFKLGFEPNAPTVNTLINGFLLENRVVEAAGIFNKMIKAGNCQPSAITFGTLVKGLCMKGNNGAAIQLLRKMEERAFKPDRIVYNTIIDSLCKDTLLVDALNLLSEMMSKGIAPDVRTYTSLIQGACKLGKWKEATRLLNEMVLKIFFQMCTPSLSWLTHFARRAWLWKQKAWSK